MQDFHPDALYEKLEIFSRLSSLRQRLKTPSTFAKAAQEMRAIGLAAPPAPSAPVKARGSVIATDAKLSDFARFLDQPTAAAAEPDEAAAKTSLNAFLHRIIAPHVSAAKDPQQNALVAAADEAISAMMREVLHHPDFQALESLWRSLELLVRRVETGPKMEFTLIDLSAEEFAADLGSTDDLASTALYRLLVEDPAEDAKAGPFSAVVPNYAFERTPPHADLLGRAARVVACGQMPFLAAIGNGVLDEKPDDLHPLIQDAWAALRALPEAGYLGLGLPRFMLRMPYGKKTEPIDSFAFEEFTIRMGLRSLLWANPAVAAGLLLAETFNQQGEQMRVGSVAGLDELPYYCYDDADGDQTALPCTERYVTARTSEAMAAQGFLPLLGVKNSPVIRVGRFRSVGGDGNLAGFWAPVPYSPPAAAPPAYAPAYAPADAPAAQEPAAPPAGADAPAAEPAGLAPSEEAAAQTVPPAAAQEPASDPELDALLASLSAEPEPPPASDDAVDPDLAKLLAELG